MFRFRTDHTNQERRDGFVSFRCFRMRGGRGGDRTLRRGGERTLRGWKRTGTGIGEEDGTLRGWKRTEEESERTDTGL